MQKIKVMIASTGRADYGLLYPLIKQIIGDNKFDLQLIATGTHLSPLHGKTIKLIEEDKDVHVAAKVEMTMKSDTEDAICNSIAIGLIGFSRLFNSQQPDILIVLGDRYELWSICIAAVIHKIPIAHIHGGEATFGLIDDPIRHSVSKMSAFHFASIELYAKRIIQMGENPERVFVVGAIGLDNIKNIPLMTLQELSEYSQVDFSKKIALMTYHPVTLDSYDNAAQQVKEILNALTETDLFVLMTMPNSDTSGNVIYQTIKSYAQQFPEKFRLIDNLGQKAYLSAMKHAKLMIGNSSSGIVESASFKLPVVNIGDRQAGRFKPKNVINCACTQDEITEAINHALSDEFRASIDSLESPYGDGNTAARIITILKSIDFTNKTHFLKKGFYDLKQDVSQLSVQRVK